MNIARIRRLWLMAVTLAVAGVGQLRAQAQDQREASVGMRGIVEQVVLEGSELVPAASSFEAPVVVRVLKTWPHGEHLRYDLEWVGYEPGSYNLTDYLVRKDGSAVDGLKPIEVTVTSVLPDGANEPGELDFEAAQRVGGYTTLGVVLGVLWGVGLLAILFAFRKKRVVPAPAAPKPTLADRLRPLVEQVAAGDADEARKAELERLLVAFWRSRLDLGSKRAVDAIVAIKQHERAGALLRQVEAWLHMPTPPKDFDVKALLEPYRSVAAEDFEKEAG